MATTAWRWVLGVVTGVALCAAATAEDEPGVARLEALGKALRRHSVWQADYQQEYTPAGMTQGESQAGEVWVAWPDRALFVAGRPGERLMGLERRRVRLVDRELASCDEHELTDDEWARVPLAALLDPSGAGDRFVMSPLGQNGLALVPRSPGGVARVEVLADGDGMPVEVVVVDPQGAVNRLSFSGWQSAAAPTGGWLPEPPEGVACTGMDAE